jgi:hypothetical protein
MRGRHEYRHTAFAPPEAHEDSKPSKEARTEKTIRKMLAKGTGKLKIAKQLGVGVSTVQRVAAA